MGESTHNDTTHMRYRRKSHASILPMFSWKPIWADKMKDGVIDAWANLMKAVVVYAWAHMMFCRFLI